MSEKILDMQTIFQRLITLEENLEHLRQSFKLFAQPGAAPQTAQHPYIETAPDVLGGEPVIKGTRTPVRAVVEHWKFGDSPEEILRHLPHLRLALGISVISRLVKAILVSLSPNDGLDQPISYKGC